MKKAKWDTHQHRSGHVKSHSKTSEKGREKNKNELFVFSAMNWLGAHTQQTSQPQPASNSAKAAVSAFRTVFLCRSRHGVYKNSHNQSIYVFKSVLIRHFQFDFWVWTSKLLVFLATKESSTESCSLCLHQRDLCLQKFQNKALCSTRKLCQTDCEWFRQRGYQPIILDSSALATNEQ